MYPGSSHRRLSLQQSMSMMRSEPNIHRRCSLDPLTLKKLTAPFEFHSPSHGQSQSLGRLPLHSNSPSASHLHSSPHGSNSHLSNHGSNSSLNDQLYPTFTSPDDPMEQQELRSKSLGNIYSSLSSHTQQQQQQSSPVQQALSQQQQQQQQQQLSVPLQQQASPAGSTIQHQHQHQQLLPLPVSGALGAAAVGSTAGVSGASGGSGGNGGGGVGAQKRRASYGFNNLTRSAIKRPRYARVCVRVCVHVCVRVCANVYGCVCVCACIWRKTKLYMWYVYTSRTCTVIVAQAWSTIIVAHTYRKSTFIVLIFESACRDLYK